MAGESASREYRWRGAIVAGSGDRWARRSGGLSGLPSVFSTGDKRAGVMARGGGGRVVFEDDEDRKAWLGALGKACAAHGWQVQAWALMCLHFD